MDPSLKVGTIVIPMTMGCAIICLAALPLPPAALQQIVNHMIMAMNFIQCATVIMKARSLLIIRFMGILCMPLYVIVYASDIVSICFRADSAEVVVLHFILS